MASSRRMNGRSPLVRKQSQITTFFSPGKSTTPSPTPTATSSPNPSPKSTPDPSPSQSKQKKPLLAIPSPPALTPPGKKSYSSEVVGRRIKVFWPLDDAWYEGVVKNFDPATDKHVVQYDDAEEESIDLDKEKIEWITEAPRGLRRLRRLSDSGASVSNTVAAKEGSEGEDSSDDEDWGKNIGKDNMDDDSEEVELDEEEEEDRPSSRRSRASSSAGSRKRKSIGSETLKSIKKIRFDGNGAKDELKTPPSLGRSNSVKPTSIGRLQTQDAVDTTLTGDAMERFGKREAEKFKFLGARRKDACGRKPGDADYDPRTLFLPHDFLSSLTGGQRQWWEFKSEHMDKVLFFKMGKFYEMFEMDAHVGARELDLQYMKGDQPHCGFPEKNFSMNLEKLAGKGYRVLVVEQTETPGQLELRRKELGCKDKVVKREICAMVTKGTLTEGELLLTNPDASYLMSITENCQTSENQYKGTVLGICVVDVSTSKFMVGQFEDDSERCCLCSILAELRPVEIVKPSKLLSPETERVLRHHTRNPLVNALVPSVEFWDAEKTICEISNNYTLSNVEKDSGTLPDVLSELVRTGQNGHCALSALGGCLFYLRQAFLDVALLKCAKFEPLPCPGFLNNLQKPYMILDASALENLEILENNRNGGPSGTLFAQLDHCMTSFGKRLLKGWLARPLNELGLIIERQDAIAAFKGVGLASALEFRKELSRLPDMERLLARLFSRCDANGRNASRVVLYEDASMKQLQEFIAALRGCRVMFQACSSLESVLASTESSLLHHLLTPGEGLPDLSSVLKHFGDAFDWSEADRTGRIIPHEGGDIEYDAASRTVKEIESALTMHLKEQHKLLRDTSINYVSVGKDLYLLEVPESLAGAVPRDYELRSSKKGYYRYWTPEIKKYLLELSQAEAEKESKLKSILQRLILHFSEYHSKWRQLVSLTAEIDVLISLAIASDYYEGPTCRPVIKDRCHLTNAVPSLSARSLGHPVLRSEALGKSSFVPNDINIGGAGHSSFILLTGPNMGGKSTLLRQVCIAVILAQIGADIPAESFELSLVDRIFVRMGARDHIMSGQSTFLMELSETASMLSSATRNSLVALDELGRGTSTSDGQAIAGSVLEYFVHEIQCRGLFSTHYHRLAVDYEKDTKVSLCHMACRVGKGNEGVEEVTFLYRLTPGSCPKSYGVNVARLAGIPLSVLQRAMVKSKKFEENYGTHKNGFQGKLTELFRDEDEIAVVLRKVFHAAEMCNLDKDVDAIDLGFLREIQQRARLLVM